jgi:hypothetical protein
MGFHRALSAKAIGVFVPYLPQWWEFGQEGPTPDGEKRHKGQKTASKPHEIHYAAPPEFLGEFRLPDDELNRGSMAMPIHPDTARPSANSRPFFPPFGDSGRYGLALLAPGVLPEHIMVGGVDMAPRSGAGAMTMVLDLVILSPISALKRALS